ncbi:hypothetical protein BKA61DRAFT_732685 [Leptodontidium sp. MPI-SDFR-AT-0119]|nr:hypothetical protein BKA61DRAFT_732685 [Leptodontidium sp. MPI-SDFR-AT-0119]
MASPVSAIEPMLASSMRVMRNLTAVETLISAWPLLQQKSASSPSILSDTERRLFLDLPDADLEAANIRAVTSISREQLIEQALSHVESLTYDELMLLNDRFWTPITAEEKHAVFEAMAKTSEDGLDKYLAAREFDSDEAAIEIAAKEFWKRKQAPEQARQRAAAEAALPYAKEWIQHLYREDNMHWGFVCLYNKAVQQLNPGQIEHFNYQMEDVFRTALMYNGSTDIISRKWKLLSFNAPDTDFSSGSQADSIFLKAFQDILDDPQRYQSSENVATLGTMTEHFVHGIAGSGLLTNTFLVINPEYVSSILNQGRSPLYDDMWMMAYEADFPKPGHKYIEGYEGFTRVRLDQLVYNFYELRLKDEIGIDRIWEAAQKSRNRAFIGMDPEEATSSITNSNVMRGFSRDSVLGKRWYAMKAAREA